MVQAALLGAVRHPLGSFKKAGISSCIEALPETPCRRLRGEVDANSRDSDIRRMDGGLDKG